MSVAKQEMIHFHLTGRRGQSVAGDVLLTEACPALLVPYRDLSNLRYDYPLILLDDTDTHAFVDTLSGVVNRLLREIAPEGNAGERLRQHVLRLETRMRKLMVDGFESSLTQLWEKAERSLLAECAESEVELLRNSLSTARFALRTEGQVVDCSERLPALLLQHAWTRVESRRTRKSLDQISTLIIRLRNLLKVDDLKTDQSREPKKLKQTLGRRYKEAFDFELMAELLQDSTPNNRLPADRRRRIESALAILESQKFFFRIDDEIPRDGGQYSFAFNSVNSALKAYDERLPEIADIIRAIAIAELECENAYREAKHAAYFERFGAQSLEPADVALFPSYLICLQDCKCDSRDMAELMDIASSDLPMKVLFQVSNVLGEPSLVDRQPHHGAFVQQMANTFVAPGNAYVLQSASSDLYRQKDKIQKGLEFRGPAIFSIFAGRDAPATSLPAYLSAAAAMESRAFPAFSYDPAAGSGLADRFDVSSNPDIGTAWPRRELRYEDEGLQLITEEHAFTLADFAVTDPQYSDYFASAPRESWNDDMLPVADYLDLPAGDTFEKVPYVPVVDGHGILRRLVVDENLIRIVRHCRDRWHVLQEQGGIDNSYAAALLAKERTAWEEEKEKQIQMIRAELAHAGPSQTVDAVLTQAPNESAEKPLVVAEEAATAISDEPYIETPRCTTCDECTNRNDRMFAYDENKQAYIKDPDAGSYKDLVEAAEICQVAIIHPGKPRNPNEPGLDDLVGRAQAFMA